MKSILLVDDDPAFLKELEVALHPRRREWLVESVVGGEAGLARLQQQCFDVVVSGLDLSSQPGGQSLLSQIREVCPSAVRIALADRAHEDSVVQAALHAHQFVSQPCSHHDILETLDRACSLSELVGDDALRDVVGPIESIPEPPHTYFECCRILESEDSSAEAVASVVRQAPNLVAKLLQMVNSVFFALPQPTSDIEKAIGLLGVDTIRGLVLALEATALAEDTRPVGSISLDSVLQASVLSANLSRKMRLPTPEAQEQLFTSCLLHDIGLLVLLKNRPDFVEAAVSRSKQNRVPLIVACEELGLPSYASVGAYLLGAWGLPLQVVEAVRDHTPHPVGKGQLALAVHLMDHATKSALSESCGVNEFTRTVPLEGGILAVLGAERVESLKARARSLVEPDQAAAA